MTSASLIQKYNVPGPRYTSYPAVPHWNTADFDLEMALYRLRKAFVESNAADGISLYIHLPYCESLCTFCACHKRITKNHAVETPYINALLTEWNTYCDLLPEPPRIAELHLGGGTPSFFAPTELRRLLTGLFSRAVPATDLAGGPDFGWEGHPNNTTAEHLQVMYDFGFRRVSFGVQDYDPVVQKAIHRIQPFENVQRVTEQARQIGYTSISHDLVFGLPFQTPEAVRQTIEKTLSLRPDRIAFYAYAHVPWIKGTGQRGFDEGDLPTGPQKRILYETGRELLEGAGYTEIGMDHFALPHDSLHQAMQRGTLHRNFMGYTVQRTRVLIGLGASAISDFGTAFMQNEKEVDAYLRAVQPGQVPVWRGHLLTKEDAFIRRQILNLMCRFRTQWQPEEWTEQAWNRVEAQLQDFAEDGLIDYTFTSLRIRLEGQPFLRNICMAFDQYLPQNQVGARQFSSTV